MPSGKALEMYIASARAAKLPRERYSEISNRIFNALALANPKLLNKDLDIDIDLLEQVILTGEIWSYNQIGHVAVGVLCEWIVKNKQEEPSRNGD